MSDAQPGRGPRVLVVAEPWGELDALATARAVADGWGRQAPHVRVETRVSHHGGAGFAALVGQALDGSTHPVLVPGPLPSDHVDAQVPAAVVMVEGPGGRTAYLDTAQVAGRHLVPAEHLADPTGMTSAGIGALLVRARDLGATRIVVGVGALAPHDGGTGLLHELGVRQDLADLSEVRRDWEPVSLVLATTTDAPLLGFHGASASLGDLGVGPAVTQRLEAELGELTDRVNAAAPPPRDLLTGLPRRPEREPGAGAGGGVGYALQLLGARTDTGAGFCLDELGIRELLPGSLLVLVTEAYDYHTVHQGVVADTARAALASATPTVVLAREVSVGRREGMALGISGSYATRQGEDLAALGARVARTWTPPPAREV